MIFEWMLGTLLDYAKNGAIASISKVYQENLNFILDKNLRELECKYFGFSRTSFKDFIKTSEFQTHLEQHLTDRELDLEYLGEVLSEYVNLEEGMSGKTFLQEFYDKFEINLIMNPELKAQLDLRSHKLAERKLQNIQESIGELSQNYEKRIKLLECFVQKKVQESDFRLCLHGHELSKDQILDLAANALKRAKSKYEKGITLTVLGEFGEAELQFDGAIEHNPECIECYFARGNTRSLQNKFREACEDYSEAIKLDPTFALAWYNKGNALDHLDKSDEALKCFDKAIEINPQLAEAWYNKGNALDHLGKSDEALRCFNKAIEINPKYAETWYNKGTVLGKLGKSDEALKCFDKAIRINSQLAEAWANKGLALDHLDKSDEALKYFDKAIEINPQLAKAWYNEGNALIKLGKTDDALKCFDNAIRIDPKYAKAWYNKGNALIKLGKTEDALKCFDKAIEINPNICRVLGHG